MNASFQPETRGRLKRIQIKGMRCLEDIAVDLQGLTVLIGSNGSGKSSIVEAFELFRRLSSPQFFDEFQSIHGGLGNLIRVGSDALVLALSAEFQDQKQGLHHLVSYTLELPDQGQVPLSGKESFEFRVHSDGQEKAFFRLSKEGTQATIEQQIDGSVSLDERTLGWKESILHTHLPDPTMSQSQKSFRDLLATIDVHLPFEVAARWSRRALRKPSELREAAELAPTEALAPTGHNLVNAYHTLKNEFSASHWRETMELVRLGLGSDIDSINTRTTGGGGLGLWVKYSLFDKQLPASAFSDGELAYLAFIALYRLNTHKSIIVFDEPDLHMHPRLLLRVLDLFGSMAKDGIPILLTTHSDRLLDGLEDPASSVVLCQLDPHRATQLLRPDPEALQDWLLEYRGLGAIRSEGHEASIMTQKIEP